MTKLDFYFDFISPFAFFAARAIEPLAQRCSVELVYRPVLFAGMLKHFGQLGPAEIPPKREYTFKFCSRYAAEQGLRLVGPKAHPFNPLTALRMSGVAGAQQAEVVQAIFDAIWLQGIDGSDGEALVGALERRGLPGSALHEAAQTSEAKNALRAQTEAAIARGTFGVPTFVAEVGGVEELFWGVDSLGHLERFCKGDDPLDREAIEGILSRPERHRKS